MFSQIFEFVIVFFGAEIKDYYTYKYEDGYKNVRYVSNYIYIIYE